MEALTVSLTWSELCKEMTDGFLESFTKGFKTDTGSVWQEELTNLALASPEKERFKIEKSHKKEHRYSLFLGMLLPPPWSSSVFLTTSVFPYKMLCSRTENANLNFEISPLKFHRALNLCPEQVLTEMILISDGGPS